MILGRSQKVKQFFSQLRKDIQSQIQWLLDLDTEVTSPITTELGILRDKCKRFLSRTPQTLFHLSLELRKNLGKLFASSLRMNLELYHRESCPYSAEVRNFISENDLEDVVSYYDVGKDGSKLTQLKSMTDDEQVPCLVIDGEPLLESADIIAWLDKNKGEFLC